MTTQYVLDKNLTKAGVQWRSRGGLTATHYDVIHHRQRGHQFGPRALRQQRFGRIRHFHHQQPPRLPRLGESLHMFSGQGVEITGYPAGGVLVQPLLDFVERDDFCSRIQKQSLAVTCSDGSGLFHPQLQARDAPDANVSAGWNGGRSDGVPVFAPHQHLPLGL